MVNFDWGTGSPDPSVFADLFAVRWTGIVQPRLSDNYSFYTTSDDGVRLWINEQLIINNWTDHGPTEDIGSIPLAAGQPYTVRMEFYENGGGATAKFAWSATGLPKEFIPQTQLYPFTNLTLTIASQPQSTNILKGNNLNLSVLATGFNPKTYQWYFNQTNLINGATNSAFTLANIQPTNAGAYQVLVSDPTTNVLSIAATVNVLEIPVVTSPTTPLRLVITAGDTLTLTATAAGTLPISYSWRRNFLQFTNMIITSGTSTVVLSNVQPASATGVLQTNTYTLRVTNIASQPATLYTIAAVRVLNPPVITNQPLSQTTGLSSNVTFRVGASGGTPQ